MKGFIGYHWPATGCCTRSPHPRSRKRSIVLCNGQTVAKTQPMRNRWLTIKNEPKELPNCASINFRRLTCSIARTGLIDRSIEEWVLTLLLLERNCLLDKYHLDGRRLTPSRTTPRSFVGGSVFSGFKIFGNCVISKGNVKRFVRIELS